MLVLCSRNARPEKGRGSRQTIFLARRAPTMKRWSLDARSEGQAATPLVRQKDHGSWNKDIDGYAEVGTRELTISCFRYVDKHRRLQ